MAKTRGLRVELGGTLVLKNSSERKSLHIDGLKEEKEGVLAFETIVNAVVTRLDPYLRNDYTPLSLSTLLITKSDISLFIQGGEWITSADQYNRLPQTRLYFDSSFDSLNVKSNKISSYTTLQNYAEEKTLPDKSARELIIKILTRADKLQKDKRTQEKARAVCHAAANILNLPEKTIVEKLDMLRDECLKKDSPLKGLYTGPRSVSTVQANRLHTMEWKDVKDKLTHEEQSSLSVVTQEARTKIVPANSDSKEVGQRVSLEEYWNKLTPDKRLNLLSNYKEQEKIINKQVLQTLNAAAKCPFQEINKYSVGNHALNVFVKEFQTLIIQSDKKNDKGKMKRHDIGTIVESLLKEAKEKDMPLDQIVDLLASQCEKDTPLYTVLCRKAGFMPTIFGESQSAETESWKTIHKAAQVAKGALRKPESGNSTEMTPIRAAASPKPLSPTNSPTNSPIRR